MSKKLRMILFLILAATYTHAQYWQQEVQYDMNVELKPATHRLEGTQSVKYTNHSPDTLNRIFYHLYWNAFQPNSMMDMRSRTISDPDSRVGGRIHKLTEEEIGWQEVSRINQNGTAVPFTIEGTIMEVTLADPLAPGETHEFALEWSSQVPAQIRRAGRDNSEGIDYSMSQWYPKICAYDEHGWHPNPYVAREFYGNWGDFQVTIKAPAAYTVAAGGVLRNAKDIPSVYGYPQSIKDVIYPANQIVTWEFVASNVHDFMWAADRDYSHTVRKANCGVEMHFFYQSDTAYVEKWKQLPKVMNEVFSFVNQEFGTYPYPVYSFIQGGDGGMEYPMGTLITGNRSFSSLVGVSVHELMHSWYQMMLGTDEARFAWMDEGFTSYASAIVMNHLKQKRLIPGDPVDDPLRRSILGYSNFVQTDMFEPLSTHADHFATNAAYSVASYVGGAVILDQLGFIIGENVRDRALRTYFNEWRFKLPESEDFFRLMERESGIILDWYEQYMVHSTKIPDYAVDTVFMKEDTTVIQLRNIGQMPMPLDVKVETNDGSSHLFHLPLEIMRGAKPLDDIEGYDEVHLAPDWKWTHPVYTLHLPIHISELTKISIDPKLQMMDANRENNVWPVPMEE